MDGAYSMDKSVTDSDIEKMISRFSASTHELLIQHQRFLLDVSVALDREGKIESAMVAEIATQNGVVAVARPEGYLHLPPYADVMNARQAKLQS
jgi:hypothetical protein